MLHPRLPASSLHQMVAFLESMHLGANVQRSFGGAGGPWEFNLRDLLRWCYLAEGAVLGKITASSKHILSLSAAVDGSQAVDLVLAHACDASAADKEAIAYETGQVVASALVLGAAHTIANIRDAMRDKGLVIDD